MSTDVEVCRNALLHLGENSISSLSDGTNAANTCASMYPPFRLGVFAAHPWNFARTRVQLMRLVESPVNEWTYQFQIPPNVARPEAVYNSTAAGARGLRYGWERVGNVIQTDFTVLVLKYIAEKDEGQWPGTFQVFMEYALAAHICMGITGKKSLADQMHAIAYGPASDEGRGGWFARAAQADSASDLGDVVDDYSLINARWGGDGAASWPR